MTKETRLLLTVTFLAAGVAGGLVLGRALDGREVPTGPSLRRRKASPTPLRSRREP